VIRGKGKQRGIAVFSGIYGWEQIGTRVQKKQGVERGAATRLNKLASVGGGGLRILAPQWHTYSRGKGQGRETEIPGEGGESKGNVCPRHRILNKRPRDWAPEHSPCKSRGDLTREKGKTFAKDEGRGKKGPKLKKKENDATIRCRREKKGQGVCQTHFIGAPQKKKEKRGGSLHDRPRGIRRDNVHTNRESGSGGGG